MQIVAHHTNRIAEIIAEDIIIHTAQDGSDLLGNVYYQGFESVILHEKNITPEFFDLKTGIAGEILQKFSNYRVKLAIVGDFSKYQSKSMKDFIYESNKGKQVNFVDSSEDAIAKLNE